ncbi:MAG: thioredoxin family protein [Candidatus Bathyarchaeia archaeon]|nr:thioredoxin family protein [Candidatus Bathyarchaeota archaeon]
MESEGNSELAEDFGVMETPTLIFFCEGRPLMHLVGFMPEVDLRRAINDMLSRAPIMLNTNLKSILSSILQSFLLFAIFLKGYLLKVVTKLIIVVGFLWVNEFL